MNSANDSGGAISNRDNCNIVLTNCTISGNSATFEGGGLYNWDDCYPKLANCILWANTDGNGTGEAAQIYGGTPEVNHCCIQGWTRQLGGIGNISGDPLFASDPQGDYYLSQIVAGQAQKSPCVNSGNDLATKLGMDKLTTRTDKITDDGVVDMGYHYSQFNSNSEDI
jgi:hypothetical protein